MSLYTSTDLEDAMNAIKEEMLRDISDSLDLINDKSKGDATLNSTEIYS
tara:strand:- start:817 stop:963 length:147 start_codon:yes stop_codon:yes gene_type:complete